MRLADLAGASGISVSYLSQIERGLSTPSIKVLHEISRALRVQIGWFFRGQDAADPEERPFIVRRKQRRVLAHGQGITDFLLSPNLGGRLELLYCEFEPNAASGEEPYSHEGEEAGYLLSGQLELWIGSKRFLLAEGDSFTFPSDTPHRYRNPSKSDAATVLWAITPPSY